MITTVAVSGYRSLRDVVLPLGQLTIVTGANGVGKSSLYRALRLLGACGREDVVAAVAREGGLESVLWAGPEQISRSMRQGEHAVQGGSRRGPIALRLGVQTAGPESGLGYALELGVPAEPRSAFCRDPEVKAETVWSGDRPRPSSVVADRHGAHARIRDDDGAWQSLGRGLAPFETALSEVADPVRAPEVVSIRNELRSWRFYDHLRTDRDAPARFPQPGTRAPVLAADGADLAAAVQTIREAGHGTRFDAAVEEAFPGTTAQVSTAGGQFSLAVRQPGLLRPLSTAELSDGTLRFLLLAAAMLTPTPPGLLVVNEPETSLHAGLLPGLAALIHTASRSTQIVVVTHAVELVEAVRQRFVDTGREEAFVHAELRKGLGETTIAGQEGMLDRPTWHWPAR